MDLRTRHLLAGAMVAAVVGVMSGCSGPSHSSAAAATAAAPSPSPRPATVRISSRELLRQIEDGEGKPVLAYASNGTGWNHPAMRLKPGTYRVKTICLGQGNLSGQSSYQGRWNSKCSGTRTSVNMEQDESTGTPIPLSVTSDPQVDWAIAIFQ